MSPLPPVQRVATCRQRLLKIADAQRRQIGETGFRFGHRIKGAIGIQPYFQRGRRPAPAHGLQERQFVGPGQGAHFEFDNGVPGCHLALDLRQQSGDRLHPDQPVRGQARFTPAEGRFPEALSPAIG
jgi:hypothetical protein